MVFSTLELVEHMNGQALINKLRGVIVDVAFDHHMEYIKWLAPTPNRLAAMGWVV